MQHTAAETEAETARSDIMAVLRSLEPNVVPLVCTWHPTIVQVRRFISYSTLACSIAGWGRLAWSSLGAGASHCSTMGPTPSSRRQPPSRRRLSGRLNARAVARAATFAAFVALLALSAAGMPSFPSTARAASPASKARPAQKTEPIVGSSGYNVGDKHSEGADVGNSKEARPATPVETSTAAPRGRSSKGHERGTAQSSRALLRPDESETHDRDKSSRVSAETPPGSGDAASRAATSTKTKQATAADEQAAGKKQAAARSLPGKQEDHAGGANKARGRNSGGRGRQQATASGSSRTKEAAGDGAGRRAEPAASGGGEQASEAARQRREVAAARDAATARARERAQATASRGRRHAASPRAEEEAEGSDDALPPVDSSRASTQSDDARGAPSASRASTPEGSRGPGTSTRRDSAGSGESAAAERETRHRENQDQFLRDREKRRAVAREAAQREANAAARRAASQREPTPRSGSSDVGEAAVQRGGVTPPASGDGRPGGAPGERASETPQGQEPLREAAQHGRSSQAASGTNTESASADTQRAANAAAARQERQREVQKQMERERLERRAKAQREAQKRAQERKAAIAASRVAAEQRDAARTSTTPPRPPSWWNESVRLVVSDSVGSVYLLENGTKRAVPSSQVLSSALGIFNSNVRKLQASELADIPDGETVIDPTPLGSEWISAAPVALSNEDGMVARNHFHLGGFCTLSFWVWLWEHPPTSATKGAERVIVRPSPASPYSAGPGVYLGVGAKPEHFFFAATQNSNAQRMTGVYSRYPAKARQWTHISISLQLDQIVLHVNGVQEARLLLSGGAALGQSRVPDHKRVLQFGAARPNMMLKSSAVILSGVRHWWGGANESAPLRLLGVDRERYDRASAAMKDPTVGENALPVGSRGERLNAAVRMSSLRTATNSSTPVAATEENGDFSTNPHSPAAVLLHMNATRPADIPAWLVQLVLATVEATSTEDKPDAAGLDMQGLHERLAQVLSGIQSASKRAAGDGGDGANHASASSPEEPVSGAARGGEGDSGDNVAAATPPPTVGHADPAPSTNGVPVSAGAHQATGTEGAGATAARAEGTTGGAPAGIGAVGLGTQGSEVVRIGELPEGLLDQLRRAASDGAAEVVSDVDSGEVVVVVMGEPAIKLSVAELLFHRGVWCTSGVGVATEAEADVVAQFVAEASEDYGIATSAAPRRHCVPTYLLRGLLNAINAAPPSANLSQMLPLSPAPHVSADSDTCAACDLDISDVRCVDGEESDADLVSLNDLEAALDERRRSVANLFYLLSVLSRTTTRESVSPSAAAGLRKSTSPAEVSEAAASEGGSPESATSGASDEVLEPIQAAETIAELTGMNMADASKVVAAANKAISGSSSHEGDLPALHNLSSDLAEAIALDFANASRTAHALTPFGDRAAQLLAEDAVLDKSLSYGAYLALGLRYEVGYDATGRPVEPRPYEQQIERELSGNTTKDDPDAHDPASDGQRPHSPPASRRSRIHDAFPEVPIPRSCRAAAAYLNRAATRAINDHYKLNAKHAMTETVRLSDGDFTGHKGEDDEVSAFQMNAAEKGDARAQMWVGTQYYWGRGGLPRDQGRAVQMFQQAAAQGLPEAHYNMGVMHMHGDGGLPADQEAAAHHFEEAAENGYAPAQNGLGHQALTGSNPAIPRNATRALELFRRAAEGGSADGHFNLASMLQSGSHVERDVESAAQHYAIAAYRGHTRAARALGNALVTPGSWLDRYDAELYEKYIAGIAASDNATAAADAAADGVEESSPDAAQQREHGYVASPEVLAKLPGDRSASTAHRRTMHLEISSHGSTSMVDLPLRNDCEAGLHFLRTTADIGEWGAILRDGLDNYLDGDVSSALPLYEIAAELGYEVAQSNTAFLYEQAADGESSPIAGVQGELAPTRCGDAELVAVVVDTGVEVSEFAAMWHSLRQLVRGAVRAVKDAAWRALPLEWSSWLLERMPRALLPSEDLVLVPVESESPDADDASLEGDAAEDAAESAAMTDAAAEDADEPVQAPLQRILAHAKATPCLAEEYRTAALERHRQAGALGYEPAALAVADAFRVGSPGGVIDMRRAVDQYAEAAIWHSSPQALFTLGMLTLAGDVRNLHFIADDAGAAADDATADDANELPDLELRLRVAGLFLQGCADVSSGKRFSMSKAFEALRPVVGSPAGDDEEVTRLGDSDEESAEWAAAEAEADEAYAAARAEEHGGEEAEGGDDDSFLVMREDSVAWIPAMLGHGLIAATRWARELGYEFEPAPWARALHDWQTPAAVTSADGRASGTTSRAGGFFANAAAVVDSHEEEVIIGLLAGLVTALVLRARGRRMRDAERNRNVGNIRAGAAAPAPAVPAAAGTAAVAAAPGAPYGAAPRAADAAGAPAADAAADEAPATGGVE